MLESRVEQWHFTRCMVPLTSLSRYPRLQIFKGKYAFDQDSTDHSRPKLWPSHHALIQQTLLQPAANMLLDTHALLLPVGAPQRSDLQLDVAVVEEGAAVPVALALAHIEDPVQSAAVVPGRPPLQQVADVDDVRARDYGHGDPRLAGRIPYLQSGRAGLLHEEGYSAEVGVCAGWGGVGQSWVCDLFWSGHWRIE